MVFKKKMLINYFLVWMFYLSNAVVNIAFADDWAKAPLACTPMRAMYWKTSEPNLQTPCYCPPADQYCDNSNDLRPEDLTIIISTGYESGDSYLPFFDKNDSTNLNARCEKYILKADGGYKPNSDIAFFDYYYGNDTKNPQKKRVCTYGSKVGKSAYMVNPNKPNDGQKPTTHVHILQIKASEIISNVTAKNLIRQNPRVLFKWSESQMITYLKDDFQRVFGYPMSLGLRQTFQVVINKNVADRFAAGSIRMPKSMVDRCCMAKPLCGNGKLPQKIRDIGDRRIFNTELGIRDELTFVDFAYSNPSNTFYQTNYKSQTTGQNYVCKKDLGSTIQNCDKKSIEDIYDDSMICSAEVEHIREGCILEGTLVDMADGTKKKIDDIKIGDKVFGINEKIFTVKAKSNFSQRQDKMYSINDGKAFFTVEHPILTTKGWKSINSKMTSTKSTGLKIVGDLKVGDVVVNRNGQEVIVKTIKSHTFKNTPHAYNLSVDEKNGSFIANGYVMRTFGQMQIHY